MNDYQCIAPDVILGKNVTISKFINLYGCKIDDETKIGAFVEIQKNASIGKRCKISSHTFICDGVSIGNFCFIGHGVMFINDNYPRAVNTIGELESETDWKHRYVPTLVGNNVTIGSNVTILGNVRIGDNVIIGAGTVVIKDIPARQIWAGNPARFIRDVNESELYRSESTVS
jgi:acetyltransferase-like isoleucine patch superfamily enzyme